MLLANYCPPTPPHKHRTYHPRAHAFSQLTATTHKITFYEWILSTNYCQDTNYFNHCLSYLQQTFFIALTLVACNRHLFQKLKNLPVNAHSFFATVTVKVIFEIWLMTGLEKPRGRGGPVTPGPVNVNFWGDLRGSGILRKGPFWPKLTV